jgi:methionyl aminopeptidase
MMVPAAGRNVSTLVKVEWQLGRMRRAGEIVAQVLAAIESEVAPGVTTAELDALAYEIIIEAGGTPSFKGYHGYPATICASINEQIVHGIPDQRRLSQGDILSVDVGVIYEGYQGDAARTFGVGKIGSHARSLLRVTAGALAAATAKAVAGNRLGDVSNAVQQYAEARGYAIVREYTGHGIGAEMHEGPQIPNFGPAGQGLLLEPGMTLALEPMVSAGTWRTRILADQWTVVTADGKLSAHFENTIAVTDDEPEILTQLRPGNEGDAP